MKLLISILLTVGSGFAADMLGLEMGAPVINIIGSSTAITSTDMNGSTLRIAAVFQCAEAMTIDKLGFYYTLATGTPPTYRISLQALTTSGNPDNTVLGGGSPASATFTPPASTAWDGTTQTVTLDNGYACTRGQFLSAVIDYSSGTISGAHFSKFGYQWAQFSNARQGFPGMQSFNGSVWAKGLEQPLFFYTSTGNKTYGFPVKALMTTTISSGSEQALFFTIPSSTFSTYTVRGVRLFMMTPATGKSTKVVLYSGTTVLQTLTIDSDVFAANSSSQRLVTLWFSETTLSTLTAGTQYRIGVAPQDASNVSGLIGLTLHDAQALTAFPGGATWGYSTRASCGAPCDTTSTSWTDDSTTRPLMSFVLGDATGGGGKPLGVVSVH